MTASAYSQVAGKSGADNRDKAFAGTSFREPQPEICPTPETPMTTRPRKQMQRFLSLLAIIPIAFASADESHTASTGKAKVSVQSDAQPKGFEPMGVMADDSLPTPPEKAVDAFQTDGKFKLELIAHEPVISQPLHCTWDSRGRMWLTEYRQYQYPAGVKVVKFDQFLRAVFDKTPEPPPHGVKGADRISVLDDKDGDGFFETATPMIEGLNIATSAQVGHDGIWVLNPPYLLRYPDFDRDGSPDADPEVHLSGFGMQDTHAVANNLTWGVDGWLYGVNGSTTTCDIKVGNEPLGTKFEGQCVWRYHPKLKRFEIYAEGGGNTFSLEFDSKGRIFSGTNSSNTRGFHYVQGGYYHKNWGKHGPLTNPYAFGFLPAMDHEGDSRRFAQTFAIYESGRFGADFEGRLVAANSLHNLIWKSQLIRNGSTFRTIDQTPLLTSRDRWFRPVHTIVGPDGLIYVCDWYDTRLSHLSPVDDWHKSSGRMYRICPANDSRFDKPVDLSQQPAEQLVENLESTNRWLRQRSALEIGWRNERSTVDQLCRLVENRSSVDAIWALHGLDAINNPLFDQWVSHRDPHIRRWIVRLWGDGTSQIEMKSVPQSLLRQIRDEPNIEVRSQWAATAQRLPAPIALPIVGALLRDEDARDSHIPMQIWWAIERHALNHELVQQLASDDTFWDSAISQTFLLGRLIKRYLLEPTDSNLVQANWLLEQAPNEACRNALARGIYEAFPGKRPKLPESLEKVLIDYQIASGQSAEVLALATGEQDAFGKLLPKLNRADTEPALLLAVIETVGSQRIVEAQPWLLKVAVGTQSSTPAVQAAALRCVTAFSDNSIAYSIVKAFASGISKSNGIREAAIRSLVARTEWTEVLLQAVEQGKLNPDEVPSDVLIALRSNEQEPWISRVNRLFGTRSLAANSDHAGNIRRWLGLVKEKSGSPTVGKKLFKQHCANCHVLFGEGGNVGPALDSYARGDAKFWFIAIADPSLEIREGYQTFQAMTFDGLIVTGMISARDGISTTFKTVDGKTVRILNDEIELLKAQESSIMPSGLLDQMADDQIRDLTAYLMQPSPTTGD